MSAPRSVLVIGDACADLLVRLPRGGPRRETFSPVLASGGTGANTAVALARLQVPAALMGAVGGDGYGQLVARELAADGVDITHLTVQPEAFTTVVVAIIDQHGERAVFGWPRRGGAHATFGPGGVDARAVEGASWVHTTGMCLVEEPVRAAVLRGMALARAASIPVSLDLNARGGMIDGHLPAEFAAALWDAIALADYVLGSAQDELAPLAPAGGLEEALRLVVEGGGTAIARRGVAGALLASAAGRETVPAFRTVVVDTVGAGDVFNAGFIAARLAGEGAREAVRWGNAVAGLKIARQGGRGSPTRAEVAALLGASPRDTPSPPEGRSEGAAR